MKSVLLPKLCYMVYINIYIHVRTASSEVNTSMNILYKIYKNKMWKPIPDFLHSIEKHPSFVEIHKCHFYHKYLLNS